MENSSAPIVRVGPAGWSYEDWKGIVYPASFPKSQHPLEVLSTWFDTVEINSSFYRPNNPRYCDSWITKVRNNPRFQFTAKLWQGFTHNRDVWPETRDIRACQEGLAPLRDAGKLGAVLIQFPWSFKRNSENRQWLAKVLDTFTEFPLAVEVRHTSWMCSPFLEGLEKRDISFCNIDQPLFRDSVAPDNTITSATGYVRLHGRNREHWFKSGSHQNDRYNYLYNEEELAEWVERIRSMRKKVNDLFVVTNNHYRGQAVVNALEIQAALGVTQTGLPNELLQVYPRLSALLNNVPDAGQ